MTWDERVEAVAGHARGVTDRQAAFAFQLAREARAILESW